MITANLVVHSGDSGAEKWHKLVSDFYGAIDSKNTIESLIETFNNFTESTNGKGRWDIVEQKTSKTLLSTGGRKFGEPMTFPFTLLNLSDHELIFGLNQWAAGLNSDVIAHLLSINGKVKLWKAWDPRILKAYERGDGTVRTWPVGFDILPEKEFNDGHRKPGNIFVKNFMSDHTYARFEDLTNGNQFGSEFNAQNFEHVGAWIAIKQIIAPMQKKFPEYTLADIVRMAVGDVPRDVAVDSNSTE